MLTKITAISVFCIASLLPVASQAMEMFNGEFTVGLGPVKLGSAVITSDCNDELCTYAAHIKGSFMFIKAKINEKGTYKKVDGQVMPVITEYAEKIARKKKAVSYDFATRIINDKKKDRQFDLPEDVYPYIPLINQVILDLHAGGPRDYYEYLSQHKTKRADISAYTQQVTENGTLHHFIGKGKKNELEFFFVENAGEIKLDKIAFGAFHMSKKQPQAPKK